MTSLRIIRQTSPLSFILFFDFERTLMTVNTKKKSKTMKDAKKIMKLLLLIREVATKFQKSFYLKMQKLLATSKFAI
jgi:hypothetical protein